MRLLLDTPILLWSLSDPNRLPIAARDALAAPANAVFFSAASIWEIAIKRTLNSAVEPEVTRGAALATGFQELSVNGLHATKTRSLPHLHRDPFDRILIAQAQTEPLVLMTEDPQSARYDVGLWIL